MKHSLLLDVAACFVVFSLWSWSGTAMQDARDDFAQPTIVMYAMRVSELDKWRPGDPAVSLQRMGSISMRDMESLWSELGIDEMDWSPSAKPTGRAAAFPKLFAIQNFITFEQRFDPDELEDLRAECERANELSLDESAQRATQAIIDAVNRSVDSDNTLSFRPGMESIPIKLANH
jgi:hypothetical protein